MLQIYNFIILLINFIMKTKILSFLLLLLVTDSIGQIVFEEGYFIENDGKKTECLIKNMGWKNNPIEFNYKLLEDDKSKKITIEKVQEFEVNNKLKYQRFEVEIDRSSSNPNNLSKQRTPEWSKETLFLQVIIEGEASLYFYGESNLKRYFYTIAHSLPKQLIYKKYIGESGFGDVKTNLRYQNQLWTDLRIEGATMNSVTSTSYKLSSLEKYFIKYSEVKGNSYEKYSSTLKGDGIDFNIKISPGLSYTSLSIWADQSAANVSRDIDFGYNLNYKLGIELEIVLPFNKNKWSIFLDPKYKKYAAENEIQLKLRPVEPVKVVINTLEIGLGLRHYFFLGDKSKIYINASLIYDINFNSSKIEYPDKDLEIIDRTLSYLAVGIGYIYDNRYSIEFRRDPDRKIFSYVLWGSEINSYSLTFGYAILNSK